MKVSDAAYAYLTEKSVQTSVSEVIALAENKKQWLPRGEARDLANAYLMAELVRVETAELLYAVWEDVWGPQIPSLGVEEAAASDAQVSFHYRDIFENGLASYIRLTKGIHVCLAVELTPPALQLVAYLYGADGDAALPFSVDGWAHRDGDEEHYEGTVCEDLVTVDQLRSEPQAALDRARQHCTRLVEAVLQRHAEGKLLEAVRTKTTGSRSDTLS